MIRYATAYCPICTCSWSLLSHFSFRAFRSSRLLPCFRSLSNCSAIFLELLRSFPLICRILSNTCMETLPPECSQGRPDAVQELPPSTNPESTCPSSFVIHDAHLLHLLLPQATCARIEKKAYIIEPLVKSTVLGQ